MLEIAASGDWPDTVIKDVCSAREKLIEWESNISNVTLVGPRRLVNSLDVFYGETALMYHQVLKENGLINNFIRLDDPKEEKYYSEANSFVILFGYTHSFKEFPKIGYEQILVKIKGINFVNYKSEMTCICPKCGKEGRRPIWDRYGNKYKYYICTCSFQSDIDEQGNLIHPLQTQK